MRRIALVLAALMLALTVSACGSKDTTTTEKADAQASVTCPTDNTKMFPKVRFAADLGLAFGSVKHWIYTPYKEGKFQKGADGKIIATAKAVAAAALAAKLLSNAVDNANADPLLCKTVGKPLASLTDAISGLKGKILSGDLTSLTGIVGSIGGLESILGKNRNPITEKFNS
jgi:hypothetical protein